MQDRCQQTPEGTLRCPSLNPDSLHEYKYDNGRVLYRWIKPDGTEHDDGSSVWQYLSDEQIVQRYRLQALGLRQWFNEQGINDATIEAIETALREQRRR